MKWVSITRRLGIRRSIAENVYDSRSRSSTILVVDFTHKVVVRNDASRLRGLACHLPSTIATPTSVLIFTDISLLIILVLGQTLHILPV